MKISFFVFFLVMGIMYSCKNSENYQTHESGLEYRIIAANSPIGKKLESGNVVFMDLSYETYDGDILFKSDNSKRKYLRTISPPSHKGGSFEDGLLLLSEGDSAIFKINAENFLLNSEGYSKLPGNVKYDDDLIIKVRIMEIMDKTDFNDVLISKYHSSKEAEMEVLNNFLSTSGITVSPTESGLYYIETQKGTGNRIKNGDFVHVHYTVKLIDGNLLETSLDKAPIKFSVGSGQVIPGWEEGLLLMNEGGKATLIVPSNLAYGAAGKDNIHPYSTLLFDIEVLKIQ